MFIRRQVIVLSLLLALAGMALFSYKAFELGLPLKENTDSRVWTVEARLGFVGTGGPAKAQMRLPQQPPGLGILNENFISRGFGLSTQEYDNRERLAFWSLRRARGPQAVYYRLSVFKEAVDASRAQTPAFPPIPKLEEPYSTALEDLVSDARERSADIASFTSEMLRHINNPTQEENVQLFLGADNSTIAKAKVTQTLLAGARIPTRIANGMELRDEPHVATIRPWLEVHNGQRWLSFDVESGVQFEADRHLVWFYGDKDFVSVSGGRNVETEIFLRKEMIDSIAVAEQRAINVGSHAVEFSLFSLPIRTQAVYGVLLMIPIGALVMVLMRNVIGVPTFGTFTPILVALAFRETQLLYGIILFSFVVALGLLVRFYFEKLRLLLVPRLAAVLTVVVLLLVGISIMSNRLDLETGLSVALFPMVILTMVIERMSIVWEERGSGAAMSEGFGSLVVATMAYLVMSIDQLQYLLFAFPELLLIVLGLCLLLGRYTGFRASELIRFRSFGDSKA
ncbi:MAG: UUP1 family membrane protein [Pseudomonadota bacterium]